MTDALNPDLTLSLRVAHARMVAREIREFTFEDAGGGTLPALTPGSHLLVQAPNGATRRYSLASGPGEPWRIAVKRESGGRGGSISMVDDLAVGGGSDDYARAIADENARMARAVEAAGIKAE